MNPTTNDSPDRIPDIDAIEESRLEALEESPAYHWNKIKELAKAIELGAQDLQDQLREFHKI